jgi:hypothetical protein
VALRAEGDNTFAFLVNKMIVREAPQSATGIGQYLD